MFRLWIFLILIVVFAFRGLESAFSTPVTKTHAHNDYLNERPLEDAISFGFVSVEADILLKDTQLYVGHNREDLTEKTLMTLDEFYLQPLFARFQKNDGQIYSGYEGHFYLWIDIKYDGEIVCDILRGEIEPYLSMIYSPFQNPDGKVMLIISGDRPYDLLLKDEEGYLQIDGRPGDLASHYSATRMPVISQNVRSVCAIHPDGFLDDEDFQTLKEMVDECHLQNKMVRFWATPDNKKMWSQLLEADVDLINTDSLKALSSFLKN